MESPSRPGQPRPLAILFLVLILLGSASGPTRARADDAVAEAAVRNEAVPKLLSIRQFLTSAAALGEDTPVRVQGTVTHSLSDRTFFIQEQDAGVYVFHKPPAAFLVGELVEVTGYPSLGGTLPSLQKCRVRSLGTGTLPEPLSITPAEARQGRHDMRLIQVRGTLLPERLRGGSTLLVRAADSGETFTVDLEAFDDLTPFDYLQPGSLLEITGPNSLRRNARREPVSFNIFIRTPDDIRVVRSPPWWTPARVWRGFALVGAGLVGALLWVVTLRRQVERQTADIRLLNSQLERRVEQRTAELTEANKELEAFSYSVSHDLRAPLRHIAGFAGMLQSNNTLNTDPTARRQIDIIINASSRMGRLIDELLAFSRMNRQPLALNPVECRILVNDVLHELQPETSGRAIEWKIGPLPRVRADITSLRLVWQNLLSNAIKYTRGRQPAVIEISAQASDKEWTFCVRDNGAGFDVQYVSRLFGMFQRLHHEEDFEGSGIGLANVRRIVHRHGGRTWAEGEVDRGASFYFTLPKELTSAQ